MIEQVAEPRRVARRTVADWSGALAESGDDFATPAPFAARDLYDRAATLAGIGAWECDLDSEALIWTTGVFDLFGIPRHAKVNRRDTMAMYCEESREAMERLRADAIQRRRGFTLDARIFRADGEPRWMRLTASILAAPGRPTRLYGIKQDITDERARWEAMRRLAERDGLTNLANRSVFQTRFLDRPQAAPMLTPLGALLLFDIDGFKLVNDQWGHAAGDAALQAVAMRLSAGFPDALMAARIGGDEFAVLIPAGRSLPALEQAVARQLACVASPIAWQGKLLEVSACAGIAIAADPFAYDAEALFAAADAALYAAKAVRGGSFRTAP